MSASRSLVIFQMNDSHGYLEPHPELFWSGGHVKYRSAGGYARIASLIDTNGRDDRVLAFDCGDTIHGTYLPVRTEGQAMVPILNSLGLGAMTTHWDFAYGPDQLRKLATELKYPVLAINCYDKKTGDLAFNPFTILERNGLMVGIIGIASNIVDKTMPPSHGEGLRFTIGQEELPVFIEKLRRERVDIVIVISHLGFPQDVKLCSGTEGIDIWLSGHTHNRLFQPVYINGTAIVQSGCHGSFLSRLDLDINNKKIKDLRHQILPVVEGIIPHPEVDEIIKTSLEPYRVHLKKIVGRTATDLNRNTILESTMDNLLLDSLIDLTETQVAFSNGWRYGAPIPYGPITMNDLYNIIPMNPFISVIQLTGRELWMMMEENLERTFSRDPYKQMGGYVKRCHGLNVYFKVENPPGTRIQEFFICGKRLRPNEIYSATFVTFQAVPQEYGTGREQLDVRAIDALHQYIVKNHVVKSEFRGTVVAV